MIELWLADSAEAVDRAVAQVLDLCRQCAFRPQRLDEVATAVREALRNAVEHGSPGRLEPPIRLTADGCDGSVVVEISDAGRGLRNVPPVPDLARQIEGLDPVAGWGFYLIRCFASEITCVRRDREGHTMRLRFDAATPATAVRPRLLGKADDVTE